MKLKVFLLTAFLAAFLAIGAFAQEADTTTTTDGYAPFKIALGGTYYIDNAVEDNSRFQVHAGFLTKVYGNVYLLPAVESGGQATSLSGQLVWPFPISSKMFVALAYGAGAETEDQFFFEKASEGEASTSTYVPAIQGAFVTYELSPSTDLFAGYTYKSDYKEGQYEDKSQISVGFLFTPGAK